MKSREHTLTTPTILLLPTCRVDELTAVPYVALTADALDVSG